MWYNIHSKEDETEISIYDYIGGFDVSASGFIAEVKAMNPQGTLNVRINSGGGEVFDGLAIFNFLRDMPNKVIVHIDGFAASIASIIALAGSEVRMADNAFFMIHNPFTLTQGTSEELRKHADTLDKITDNLVNIYAKKTGKRASVIRKWMNEETWFNADEAMAEGFINKVVKGAKMAASVDLTKFNFKNIPAMAEVKNEVTEVVENTEVTATETVETPEAVVETTEPNTEAPKGFLARLEAFFADETPKTAEIKAAYDGLTEKHNDTVNKLAETETILNEVNTKVEELTATIEAKDTEIVQAKAKITELEATAMGTPVNTVAPTEVVEPVNTETEAQKIERIKAEKLQKIRSVMEAEIEKNSKK